jgi:hypothetical protein
MMNDATPKKIAAVKAIVSNGSHVWICTHIAANIGYLDAQSEKTSNHNYYDHYADDVEDVHFDCSSWNSARLGRCGSTAPVCCRRINR